MARGCWKRGRVLSAEVAEVQTTKSGLMGYLPTAALTILAFILGVNELADFDIWWHLRTGQLIPDRGVPVTDWYSFTSTDRLWLDVHWGFQLLMASVHGVLGIPGLVLLKAAIVSLTVLIASWPRAK